ncbi:allantoinase isoform X2 [Abrus precatorius]|uniref:allantoinase n=1 Tax=Abrus precatorius TaxID=3816 RepID=A0A8B8LVL1_ABRPR|nr:allantoinase isoform X2 [Abrus precatorius]
MEVLWRVLPLLTILVSFVLFFYLQDSYKAQLYPLIKLPRDECSLLPHRHFWISSKRIVTPQGIISGSVEIKEGKIVSIIEGYGKQGKSMQEEVIDYGDAVVMPGLIDVHVHLDEPGRTEWEGFDTGTRAAAAGGVTTVVDMPLNNYPTTVSKETLKLKLEAAEDKIYVDAGFWGGLVPENALNKSILEGLLSAGVLGVKSFMCPSGINDFPMTTIDHIKEGLSVLARYRRPLVVHSEIQLDSKNHLELNDIGDPRSYLTYLDTRPPSWEQAAIKELVGVTKDTRIGGPLEGAHVHIVHLSDSSASLDLIKEAKSRGDSISVETCPHYLAFSAEKIPTGDTRFKCSPPIRDAFNKEKLWEAVLGGHIDLLTSDHSPTVPELKLLEEGDFLRAWGGISNLQGTITVGNHADIVVWQPEVEFELNDDYPVFLKHPNLSAYMGSTLSGKVLDTFVRGNLVFKDGKHAPAPCGVLILAK